MPALSMSAPAACPEWANTGACVSSAAPRADAPISTAVIGRGWSSWAIRSDTQRPVAPVTTVPMLMAPQATKALRMMRASVLSGG